MAKEQAPRQEESPTLEGPGQSPVAPRIALIGTLDTKGAEIEYVRGRIRAAGGRAIVIDSGILGEPGCRADITRDRVARAAGSTLDAIAAAGSRGAAVDLMQRGLQRVVLQLSEQSLIDGALCLGGAEGALMGAAAMQALPLGLPKLVVSPSASGPRACGPFFGRADILVMHSVVDILGLNPIARAVFDNAVAAVMGMVRTAGVPVAGLGSRSVGITMLGQTTQGVMAMIDVLEDAGWEPVIFHANGVGGPAMEDLVATGALAGVVDFTLSEVANSLFAGVHATDERRLTVAGEHGVPQVVVPGCTDFFNQNALDTVPARYRSRPLYKHNPVATLVRLNEAEMNTLGRLIAHRLNAGKGPVEVLVPTQGFSGIDTAGGPFWNPQADAALTDGLEQDLDPRIRLQRLANAVNDVAFGRAVAAAFVRLAERSDRRASSELTSEL